MIKVIIIYQIGKGKACSAGGEREATGSLLLTTRAAPRSPNAYNDRISISVGIKGDYGDNTQYLIYPGLG